MLKGRRRQEPSWQGAQEIHVGMQEGGGRQAEVVLVLCPCLSECPRCESIEGDRFCAVAAQNEIVPRVRADARPPSSSSARPAAIRRASFALVRGPPPRPFHTTVVPAQDRASRRVLPHRAHPF